jgi:integrase
LKQDPLIMPSRALTVAAVERIKPPAKGQADHFDKGFPGLALRISYGGAKSWVYFYRLHGGRVRRLTLGRWPGMELADARAAWQEARKTVGKGESPTVRKPIAADSFAAVADEWLKRDQADNRSYNEVVRVIKRDVKPKWDGRLFATIGRRDVIELIDGIADRGAATLARRVHAHLHRLFKWSVGRGIIPMNPMVDLPKPGEAAARDRVLSDAELATVWRAAEKLSWPFGPIFCLLILTAARRDEIGALSRLELAKDKIELAGNRTKNGEAHIIPLSGNAIEIVETLPRIGACDYVFSTTGETPVSGWSRAKMLLDEVCTELQEGRVIAPWRIHDLRRTVATGMQRLGISLQVVEAVLGHVSGSRAGIVGIYQRHDFNTEKRAALEKWAAHVLSVARFDPAEKVVPLRSAQRA